MKAIRKYLLFPVWIAGMLIAGADFIGSHCCETEVASAALRHSVGLSGIVAEISEESVADERHRSGFSIERVYLHRHFAHGRCDIS